VRLGFLIISLASVTVALVHLRRMEVSARHETQRLEMRQVQLRRRLWDQQVDLSRLTAPQKVREQVRNGLLGLVEKDQPVTTPDDDSSPTPRPRL